MQNQPSPREALERLREGNRRFVANLGGSGGGAAARRAELLDGQEPFGIVLGCSDSRVPAEIVFDQGLGDLFVIRVAGNIVAPSQIGSIEFAAERFGSRLVVVLGHSRCGAIEATLEELDNAGTPGSPHLRSIVDRIRPALEPLVRSNRDADPQWRMREAVRANVEASVSHLRHGSALLEDLVLRGRIAIVGAEYDLGTGEVEFHEELSA